MQARFEPEEGEAKHAKVGELLPEAHGPGRVVPALLCALPKERRQHTSQGQGDNEGCDIDIGVQDIDESLHLGVNRVCSNWNSDLAPDVKAGRGEENARGECASREGVDVVLKGVDGIFYQFKRDG